MEQHDLYDINRIPTGEVIDRWQNMPKNKYRIAVHIIIFNDENEMLIQQRASLKKTKPNKWDFSVGGSIVSGETSGEGASRELSEELGIDIDFSNTIPNFTINFKEGFDDFYIAKYNCSLDDLKLQKEEVQNVKWATKEEIINMIDNRDFVCYKKSLIEFIFSTFEKPFGTWAKDE